LPLKAARRRRNLVCRPQDEALATRILRALPGADREVISRFYLDYQKAEDIEREMALRAGYVNQLKASVKARFLAERVGDTAAYVPDQVPRGSNRIGCFGETWRDHAATVWRRCARRVSTLMSLGHRM